MQETLDNEKIKAAEDYYHASMIFQHGESTEDYQKANKLVKTAMDMGDPRAKKMYANTLDRWLLSQGKPQKFGTQFRENEQGVFELILPIDESTTDEERAEYNVMSIAEAKKKLQE